MENVSNLVGIINTAYKYHLDMCDFENRSRAALKSQPNLEVLVWPN